MAHSNNSDGLSASDSSSYYSSAEYSSVESNSSMNSSTSKLRTPYRDDKATNTSKRDDMYAALKAELKGTLVIVEDSDDAFNKFLVEVYGITQKDIDYVKTKSGG
ncbi:hypothetical protein ONZ45_g4309 [Pleurotus djamor]|nr:hypothetical protein ONZ45_g4309 [Pleurotus djamor]